MNSKKVYIIGFMGSGKSTAGVRLASMLGWAFTDLDRYIEEHTGMTIPQIFSDKGENYFREVEAEMLKSLQEVTEIVISTGGGAPVHSGNMDYMLRTGLTLYLKLTPGELKSRLVGSKLKRPLIKELNDEELLGFIEEKLQFREKWYDRADLILPGYNSNIKLIYTQVRSRLSI